MDCGTAVAFKHVYWQKCIYLVERRRTPVQSYCLSRGMRKRRTPGKIYFRVFDTDRFALPMLLADRNTDGGEPTQFLE